MVDGDTGRQALHDVCQNRLSALDPAEVSERLAALPGWNLVDGHLSHTFRCENFDRSMAFIAQIATIADGLNHHPDICVHDKRSVTATLWTRQMNCLTSVDFELAQSIHRLHAMECGQRVPR